MSPTDRMRGPRCEACQTCAWSGVPQCACRCGCRQVRPRVATRAETREIYLSLEARVAAHVARGDLAQAEDLRDLMDVVWLALSDVDRARVTATCPPRPAH